MSGWEEVVDVQDELLRFWMSPVGKRYGRGFGEHMIQSIVSDKSIGERAMSAGWKPEEALDDTQWLLHLADLEAKKIMMAEPIFVNAEVTELIEEAAKTWKPEELHVEDVFPTLYGFMVFPRPFTVLDVWGKELKFRAIAWVPLDKVTNQLPPRMRSIQPADAGGVFLTAYSHKADPDDYPLSQEAVDALAERPGTRLPTLSLCHVSPWHFGSAAPIDVNGSGLDSMLVISQVAWRLARQTITTPESRSLPRAYRKRAVRSGLSSDVTLIRLRQAKHKPTDEPSAIDWQSRWIVRGHWHTYNYKDGSSKQLWISDYVKGPEDKPLRVKPLRAFELVR